MRGTKKADVDLGRLCEAMRQSRLQDSYMRDQMVEMVRERAGAHYSEDAAYKSTPINLMSLYERTISRSLISKNPRYRLQTYNAQARHVVSAQQDALNEDVQRMDLAEAAREAVISALYGFGAVVVALADPADAGLRGWTIEAGMPFVEQIDRDDIVYDIHAKKLSQMEYIGWRRRIPTDIAREIYKRKDIEATEDPMFNLEGDERISMIGRGYYSDREASDHTTVWTAYLPRHRKIVDMLGDSITGHSPEMMDPDNIYGKGNRRCLRESRFVGPPWGPVIWLGYDWISGNAIPRGPIHDIYDLHLAVNNMARKLINQAHDTKRITIAIGDDNDIKRMHDTADGYGCRVVDPQSVQQIVMNEPLNSLGILMDNFINRASWLAGNLELLGGLAPQAKTASQDKMNSQASGAGIADMQESTDRFMAKIGRSLLWYQHHHPTRVTKSHFTVKPAPWIGLTRKTYPNDPAIHGNVRGRNVRNHDWEDLSLEIAPYSLRTKGPDMQLQFLGQVIGQMAPFAQLLTQQGHQFNVTKWLELQAKYGDAPEIEELWQVGEVPESLKGDGAAPDIGAPPNQQTEHIRRSLGGDSQQAKEALNANAMSRGASSSQNGNGQMQPVPMGGGQ